MSTSVSVPGTRPCSSRSSTGGPRQRISYLTGSLVRVDYAPKIPEHRAKLAAEQAIQDVALGRQRRLLHPVCAEDFAGQAARAFATPAAANREFYIHGPEALTLRQALGIYSGPSPPASGWSPSRCRSWPGSTAFMGGGLAPNLQIMRLPARLGERGDPAPANELLGAPDTTVEAWCRAQASTPYENGSG